MCKGLNDWFYRSSKNLSENELSSKHIKLEISLQEHMHILQRQMLSKFTLSWHQIKWYYLVWYQLYVNIL